MENGFCAQIIKTCDFQLVLSVESLILGETTCNVIMTHNCPIERPHSKEMKLLVNSQRGGKDTAAK